MIRDVSGKLNSDFEKKMFTRYWNGDGDYKLTENEFNDILSNARATAISGNAITISLYHDDTYDYAIGSATLYFSTDSANLRFYDNYNFDSKPWGGRNYSAEIATRLIGIAGRSHGAKSFSITN
ncbi:MAG: hypothetical protein C0625_01660 [Arcobacter sp.]|nr:MAG: hypothetical protein C0625_01660 [Arcobacter sp.]